jgi:hypothetical protein
MDGTALELEPNCFGKLRFLVRFQVQFHTPGNFQVIEDTVFPRLVPEFHYRVTERQSEG